MRGELVVIKYVRVWWSIVYLDHLFYHGWVVWFHISWSRSLNKMTELFHTNIMKDHHSWNFINFHHSFSIAICAISVIFYLLYYCQGIMVKKSLKFDSFQYFSSWFFALCIWQIFYNIMLEEHSVIIVTLA